MVLCQGVQVQAGPAGAVGAGAGGCEVEVEVGGAYLLLHSYCL